MTYEQDEWKAKKRRKQQLRARIKLAGESVIELTIPPCESTSANVAVSTKDNVAIAKNASEMREQRYKNVYIPTNNRRVIL